eukprot:15213590-Alexandrium_andersonii.AAC.1
MRAGSVSKPACAREAIRALPQRASASMSAWWLRAVTRSCRLPPRSGRRGSRRAPAGPAVL